MDVLVCRNSELVVGITGERVILVLEILLKEGKPIGTRLGQATDFFQVRHRPIADGDRARPEQFGRLDAHDQKECTGWFLL